MEHNRLLKFLESISKEQRCYILLAEFGAPSSAKTKLENRSVGQIQIHVHGLWKAVFIPGLTCVVERNPVRF